MKHLGLTLKAGQAGHHFLCHQGVHNFWFPIIVRRCAVGIAFVQAPADGVGRGPAREKVSRAARPEALRPGRAAQPFRGAIRPMTRSEFKLAARLLQLIAQHAQTSVLADLRQRDLSRAQQALSELQSVATRLREELHHVMPPLRTTAPALQSEKHSQQVVHALLDCIAQQYAKPLTLQLCAAKLGVSVTHLSHLFSCATGMPFKMYLTEVRIGKARELLSDPTRTIANVAYAVGYASENRFRIAFKKATGLSPRVWRETLRMEPLTPSPAS